MWRLRTFKTRNAFNGWVHRHGDSNQWQEVFVNNAYAVQYRPLRRIY